MKLKCRSEDFVVEEMSTLPVDGGAQALYALTKRSIGTLEALDVIRHRWRLQRRQIAFGGLKDRHAVTRQHLTILGGPARNLSDRGIELEYLGQSAEAFTSEHIAANRFRIVVRDLAPASAERAVAVMETIGRNGVPNYFDRQRFGSLGRSGEFIARPWCLGDYERTVWLAVAEENDRDRPADRLEKELLRRHWGQWQSCRRQMRDPVRRRVVEFLAQQPGDYRRAVARLDVDRRSLYLAAYQSYLWNRMLGDLLRDVCPPESLRDVPLAGHTMPIFDSLPPEFRDRLAGLALPLPTARTKPVDEPAASLLARTLAREGMELHQLRVKYPRDSFFSKGERTALTVPEELAVEVGDDEVYSGRQRLTLSFSLPRAAYASMVTLSLEVALRENGEGREE